MGLDLAAAAMNDQLLLHVGLLLGTFVLEDAATASAALLATTQMVPVWSALIVLYFGIFVGDIALYCFGYLAAHFPRLRAWIGESRIRAGREWLDQRMIVTLVAARFVPGLRLPTYTASGYLRVSLTQFAAIAAVAATIWTSLLFALIYAFGELVLPLFGAWRWAIAALIVACVIAIPYIASLLRTARAEATK